MTCRGLHCPGCSGCGGGAGWLLRLAAAVTAASVAAGWLLARIWWLLGGTALAVAVPACAAWWLIRRQRHREAVHAASRPFVIQRNVQPALPQADRPALGYRDLHIHLGGLSPDEQAIIIRNAVTEGN